MPKEDNPQITSSEEMLVAGVMSGTSADGIDVALVRLRPASNPASHEDRPPAPFELIGHLARPYPKPVRAAILAAMNAPRAAVADLARLNFLLGELYAEAVLAAQKKFRVQAALAGCHGQTLYHQGEAASYLGRKVAPTWQTGEGAVVAARLGIPVVSDFRPADMAAGGKGAPLVPFLDYALFRHPNIFRIAQNIGGIANLTAIPPGATAEDVIAFDTGPGNMVIDALAEKFFGRRFDKNGKIAAAGTPIDSVIEKIQRADFFRQKPPKTAGREEFGREFAAEFLGACGRASQRARKADILATATALTARSVADAVKKFALPLERKKRTPQNSLLQGPSTREMIVSGGGAKNRTLVAMLRAALAPLGVTLQFSDDFGLPSEAKEAAAFALLAWETWHRRPSNIPSATGAKRPAVLGKISYP